MQHMSMRHAVAGTALALMLSACAVPASQPPAIHTFVLYPGHWQLVGARYAWVKGDETLREVRAQVYVQGHFVWRDHAWVWLPDHYE